MVQWPELLGWGVITHRPAWGEGLEDKEEEEGDKEEQDEEEREEKDNEPTCCSGVRNSMRPPGTPRTMSQL
jgi:hypothetical protein